VAKPSDKPLWDTILRGLEPHYPTLLAANGILSLPAEPAKIIVSDIQTFHKLERGDTIVLFKNGEALPPGILPPRHAIAVVNSCDERALASASSTKVPAITCGLSPRDTITLSSIASDSAVINLQRTVGCFDGTTAEPQEIPVKFGTPIDSFHLMALACIFILCADIPKLSNTFM